MRIDKYLKLTRIIKRRTISKEIINDGRVEINGKLVKPSAEVRPEDVITLSFSRSKIEVKVLVVDEKELKKDPDSAYKIISESKYEN